MGLELNEVGDHQQGRAAHTGSKGRFHGHPESTGFVHTISNNDSNWYIWSESLRGTACYYYYLDVYLLFGADSFRHISEKIF